MRKDGPCDAFSLMLICLEGDADTATRLLVVALSKATVALNVLTFLRGGMALRTDGEAEADVPWAPVPVCLQARGLCRAHGVPASTLLLRKHS